MQDPSPHVVDLALQKAGDSASGGRQFSPYSQELSLRPACITPHHAVTWSGGKRLTPYLPTENKCAAARGFKQYKLPADWNDHTINLTC